MSAVYIASYRYAPMRRMTATITTAIIIITAAQRPVLPEVPSDVFMVNTG
jgi:hypothetical protein